MAKYIKTDYRERFPGLELSNEIVECLNHSDRKMFYQEHDIKVSSIKLDIVKETVVFLPGREDSYERLQEEDELDFQADTENVENIAVRRILIERMMRYIRTLSKQEQELIDALYFKEKSERQLSAETGVHYMTIHNRKNKILGKLKKLMEK